MLIGRYGVNSCKKVMQLQHFTSPSTFVVISFGFLSIFVSSQVKASQKQTQTERQSSQKSWVG